MCTVPFWKPSVTESEGQILISLVLVEAAHKSMREEQWVYIEISPGLFFFFFSFFFTLQIAGILNSFVPLLLNHKGSSLSKCCSCPVNDVSMNEFSAWRGPGRFMSLAPQHLPPLRRWRDTSGGPTQINWNLLKNVTFLKVTIGLYHRGSGDNKISITMAPWCHFWHDPGNAVTVSGWCLS